MPRVEFVEKTGYLSGMFVQGIPDFVMIGPKPVVTCTAVIHCRVIEKSFPKLG